MRYIFSHYKIIIFTIFFLIFPIFAHAIQIGTVAPPFNVSAGDGSKMSLADVSGKVVIILYETKDVIEINRPLKNMLNELFTDNIKKSAIVLPVINCSHATFISAWKSNLRKNSEKEQLTIYGDWDGAMFKDYGMKDKTNNIIIVDKKGMVRYSNFSKLSDEDIQNVKVLIQDLTRR